MVAARHLEWARFITATALIVLARNVASVPVAGQPPVVSPASPAAEPSNLACEVAEVRRAPDGLVVWSPDGERFLVNRKDSRGVYQMYLGSRRSSQVSCITCVQRPNGPAPNKNKLQPHWHPSGRWIILAGERESYTKPIISTPELIEGLMQTGLFVNIYATTPDGTRWHRLSDFEGSQRGGGYTGPALTADGTRAAWAQIVDGNVFQNLFGLWELVIADWHQDRAGTPSFTNIRNITPPGARWVEPGGFSPDGKSLLMTADIGLKDAQGMDQFIVDLTTGQISNLTNSPSVWDEHGVFSPDGRKVFFMSSYPYRSDPFVHNFLQLKSEFMLVNRDGSQLQQLTHFNVQGYPESNTKGRITAAANGEWHPDGRSISVINLYFPTFETWEIRFKGACGARP
jgi:Tol biopolymer transport system component